MRPYNSRYRGLTPGKPLIDKTLAYKDANESGHGAEGCASDAESEWGTGGQGEEEKGDCAGSGSDGWSADGNSADEASQPEDEDGEGDENYQTDGSVKSGRWCRRYLK